jgi:hypothetical protein
MKKLSFFIALATALGLSNPRGAQARDLGFSTGTKCECRLTAVTAASEGIADNLGCVNRPAR